MRSLFNEVRTLRDLEEIFSSKELQDDRADNLEIPALLFEPKRQIDEKDTEEKPNRTKKASSSKTSRKIKDN